MQSEAKLYELSYLLKAESEEETDTANEIARTYIESGKGMILETSKPFKRHLAYTIKKAGEAYFGSLKFCLSAKDVHGLEELLKHEKRILRAIITLSPRVETVARVRREIRPPKPEEKPATDIASIDKRLEEILGA